MNSWVTLKCNLVISGGFLTLRCDIHDEGDKKFLSRKELLNDMYDGHWACLMMNSALIDHSVEMLIQGDRKRL